TEPDAEVRLGDKKVDLRPDGTFSMRFALPDGKINLPFAATSSDKVETRKITTNVERTTVSI
ncbi:MAG: Rho termination protein, partial [Candidatus Omnitrophica bacterium]|nr:Rho termination protein [Candidatus Omnitrophota bacterium]